MPHAQVEPFRSLVSACGIDVPRLVINRTRVEVPSATASAEALLLSGGADDAGLHFGEGNHRNVEWLGECDEGLRRLARLLGWEADLDRRVGGAAQGHL